MSIESAADLVGMRRAGWVVAVTIADMTLAIRAGMTTGELDAVAAATFRRLDARSAPQHEYGFPGTTCISVNDEIVHGIPGPRRLVPGDVVKIDVTAEVDGFVADAATTILLPPVRPRARRLKLAALEALRSAIAAARSGERVSVIGRAVESQARNADVVVVRELCGHGVGRRIHEDPQVPNYENRFAKDMLTDGLVLAIEPMLMEDRSGVVVDGDEWTIRTRSGCVAVHEEHTVVITQAQPILLTAAA